MAVAALLNSKMGSLTTKAPLLSGLRLSLVLRSAGLSFPLQSGQTSGVVSDCISITLFATNCFHLCAELQIHWMTLMEYLPHILKEAFHSNCEWCQKSHGVKYLS